MRKVTFDGSNHKPGIHEANGDESVPLRNQWRDSKNDFHGGRRDGLRLKTRSILVVDDEPVVRGLIRDCLNRRGFEVIDASSGAAAVEICQTQRDICLALVDVVMPGINGPKLVHCLSKLNPEIQILYMSGCPDAEAVNRGMVDFISKPFTCSNLMRRIRETMSVKEQLAGAACEQKSRHPIDQS